MKNKAPSILDNELLSLDPKYPINGSFLQKCQSLQREIDRIEKDFHPLDTVTLSAFKKEKENLRIKAGAEGRTGFKRYIQYIFSLYPYD